MSRKTRTPSRPSRPCAPQVRQSRQFVCHVMAASMALAIATWAAPTHAQSASNAAASAEASHAINLPAGSLTQSLNALAQQTGVQIIYAGNLASDKNAPALQGNYTVGDALQRLLAGSGLRAVPRDGKTFGIVADGQAAAAQQALPEVTVSGELGNVTEGTKSYTTGSTSTATKMNLSIRETPQTISVITRQRIEDQGINTMTDVLNQVPGVVMSQDGQRYNIYSRGSAINTYQFDGVSTAQENQTRHMPNTFLDMALYDHIEVLRGASGLMTGAGEPGGIVNLIRKKPTKEFKAHVQGSVGSWDNYRAEADLSGPLNESGSLRGRIVGAKQTNHSFIDRYKLDKDIFYGVVEADVSDSTLLRFSVDYQKFKPRGATGVPVIFTNGVVTNFSRSTQSAATWNTDTLETTNYTATWEQKLGGDWKLRLATNYMDGDRYVLSGGYLSSSGRSYIDQATGVASVSRGLANSHQVQKGVDLNLQGPFTLFGRRHELVAGFNYSDYESKYNYTENGNTTVNFYNWNGDLPYPVDTGSIDSVFNVSSRQRGAYLATRLNVMDRVNVFAGARMSDYDYDYLYAVPASSYNQVYTMRERHKVTPYAAVTFDLTPEQTIYASYADIFKPQSSRDRYGKVLDPVVGKNYELGWKGEFYSGRLNATAAIYQIDRDNVAADDTGYLVPGTTETAAIGIKGAKTKGIDLELSGELTPGWNVQTSYSNASTRDAQGQRTLLQLPTTTFRFWTTYDMPGAWSNLTVGGGVNWNSDNSLVFSNYKSAVKQDSYSVVSLMAKYRFSKKLVATLNINNLFDKTYYSGMTGSLGHYGDPRNAMLTMRYDF